MKVSHDGSDVLVGSARISPDEARALAAKIEASEFFPASFPCGPGRIIIQSLQGGKGTTRSLRRAARLASAPKTEAGREVKGMFDQLLGDIFRRKA